MRAFRAIDPDLTLSYAEAFLAVAEKPGHGPTEYAKSLGSVQPVVSRLLHELGSRSRRKERTEGLGLVEWNIHPESLRNKQYFLTPKGESLKEKVVAILQGRRAGTHDEATS